MRVPLHLAALLLPIALAACGGGGQGIAYRPEPGRSYAAPGPATDPWGPYIRQAAARFAIPELWIREVMRQESGGRQYLHGAPIISSAGAMGLMQVMPGTYAELAARYDLGPDPYEPRDNIMAGAGYISELAARFGSPGFLAAYDAGPRRLDDYMAGRGDLPNETIAYLDNVAPRLVGSGPMTGPLIAYAGPTATGRRYAPIQPSSQAPVEVAEAAPPAQTRAGSQLWGSATMPIAAAPYTPPEPPPPAYAPPPSYAPPPRSYATPAMVAQARAPEMRLVAPSPPSHGFAIIPSAYADTPARNASDARWGVQVGAFADPGRAHQMAETARAIAPAQLAPARTVVAAVVHPNGAMFYRARLVGMTEPAADTACGRLSARQWPCLAVPPGG